MSLNVKSDEAHRLARQLAQLTGESMTEAVTRAWRNGSNGSGPGRGGGLANRLLAIGRDCAAHLKEPYRSIDHGELLYDDLGLPR